MFSVHAWVPMWRGDHVCTHNLACSCSEGPARKRRREHSGETVRNSLFCDPSFCWSCLNKVILNKENKGLQRQALQRREFPDKECFTSSLLLQVKLNQFITKSRCRLLWSKKSAQYKGYLHVAISYSTCLFVLLGQLQHEYVLSRVHHWCQ